MLGADRPPGRGGRRCSVEFGGGIRSEDDAEELLGSGVARVVLGTAALEEPALAGRCARRWPGRVAVGLDYRVGDDGVAEAQAQGWLAGSGRAVTELLELWAEEPIGAVVATAVAATACSRAPTSPGLRRCWRPRRCRWWPRAACRALEDLPRWPAWQAAGRRLAGAIVGKAHRRGPLQRGGGGRRVRSVRLIPCLDVTGGRVVKGVRFVDLTDEGDPVELAARYDAEGADEVTFLDITASSDGRDTMVSVVARTAEQVFIPLTVGGGVRVAEDARRLLRAGADKVAVNTAAVERPQLVRDIADEFGGPVRRRGHRRPGRATDGGRAGRSTPTAGGRRRAGTWWPGRSSARPTAPARSCSPPWTATARGTASTWR